MFNLWDPNITIAAKWGMQMKMFNRMNFIINGVNETEFQPTFVNDVALAMVNAIKMDEAAGKTYDLGGPHNYTYEDVYEQFFGLTDIKPYSVVVPLEKAYEIKQHPTLLSPTKHLFRMWLYPEFMANESQELKVQPGSLGFEDLNVVPISFGHKAHEYVQEITWLWNAHETTKRDNANN